MRDETQIIEQSGVIAKAGAAASFTGAMGTWVLENSQFISLAILFGGFAVGVFFSWRRDKYLKRRDRREQIEHELRIQRKDSL